MWQLFGMHKVHGSTPRTGKQRETGGGEGKEEENRLNTPSLQTPFRVTGCTVFSSPDWVLQLLHPVPRRQPCLYHCKG